MAFRSKAEKPLNSPPGLVDFLHGFSLEVMPRTAEKIHDFRAILPQNTRIYIAHIEGTPIEEMVQTARRLRSEGFAVMPHFPARMIPDKPTLENWIAQYQGEAGVEQALLLAGGSAKQYGEFASSMDLLETGAFGAAGFKYLHVAGHPEGNKDIDPNGGSQNADAALRWKQAFCETHDATMAIATQFCFEAEPVIAWADRLKAAGITLPIHIGIAGPTRLQTLIKFSIACGVGPSLRVLQKRAKDISKLLLPFEPLEILSDLAKHKSQNPDFNIRCVHVFPLGGIKSSAEWMAKHGASNLKVSD